VFVETHGISSGIDIVPFIDQSLKLS